MEKPWVQEHIRSRLKQLYASRKAQFRQQKKNGNAKVMQTENPLKYENTIGPDGELAFPCSEQKALRIIKWIHYSHVDPQMGSNVEARLITGSLSDKSSLITCEFTTSCVVSFESTHGRRITEGSRGSVIRLLEYDLIFKGSDGELFWENFHFQDQCEPKRLLAKSGKPYIPPSKEHIINSSVPEPIYRIHRFKLLYTNEDLSSGILIQGMSLLEHNEIKQLLGRLPRKIFVRQKAVKALSTKAKEQPCHERGIDGDSDDDGLHLQSQPGSPEKNSTSSFVHGDVSELQFATQVLSQLGAADSLKIESNKQTSLPDSAKSSTASFARDPTPLFKETSDWSRRIVDCQADVKRQLDEVKKKVSAGCLSSRAAKVVKRRNSSGVSEVVKMASSDGVDDQGKLNISNWHSQSQTHSSIMPLLGSKSQLHPGWQGMKEVTLLDVTIPRQQLDILEQDSAWFPRGDFHQGQHGKSFIPLKETPQPQDYKFERKAIQALQSTSPSLPEAIHLDDLASSSDSELSWSPSPHGSPTAASKTTYGMLPDNSSSQRLEEPKLASAEQGVCRRCLERNIICSRPPISPRITSQLIQTNHDEFGTSCEGCKAAGVSCIINEDGKTALNTWLEGSAYSEDIVEHRDVGAITRSPSRLSEMSAHNAINSASPSPREPLASYADPETSDFTFLMKVPSKVPKASQQRQNTGNSNCRGKMSVSKNKHSNSRLKHESKIQEIEDPMTGNLNSDTDEELPLMVDPSGATNVAKYGILRSQQIVAKKEEKKRRLERLSQGLPEVEVESLENETECSSYDGYSSSEERNETRRRMEESMTPGCKHDTDFDSRERDSSSVSHIPAIDVGSPSSSASNASIQLIKQEAHHEDEEETKAGQVTLIIEDKISDNSTDFVPLVSHHPKSLEQNSKQVEVAGNTAQFISASDLACHPTTDKQPKPVDSPCQIQKEGINSTQKIDEEDDDDDEIPQKAPISFEPSWSFSPAVFRPSRQAEGFHLLQSSKSVKLGDNDHLPKSKEDKTGTMDSIREKKPSPKSSHRQLPTSSTLNAKSTISENSHLGIEDADINLENATAGLKGIRSTDNNVVEDSPFPSTALRPDITIQVKDTPYNASKIISLDKAPINGDKASVKHGEDPHSTDSMFGGEDCIPATALKTASQEENSPNAPQANFAPRSDPLKGCKSHESEKQCAQHNKGQNFHSESSKRKLEVLLPVNAGVKRQLIQDEDGGGQPHRRKRLHIRKIDFGIQEQEYKDIKDVVREYKQKYLEIQSVDEQANVLQATDDSIAIEQAREEESPNRKPNHPQRKQNIPLVVPSKRPVLASSHEEIIRHASSLPARGIDKPVKRRKETQPPKRLSATQRALAALLAEKPPSLPNPYSPILYQSSSKTTPDTSFSSSSKSPQKVVRPYFRSPILGSHSPQPHPRSTSRRSSQTSHSLRNSVSLRELSLSPRKRGKAATYPEDTDGSDTADVIAARPTLAPQEVQKTLAPARGLTSLLQQETPEKIESYAGIKGQDIQVLIPGYNRFQALQKIRLDERRKAYFGPGELVMKDPEDIAENGIKRKEQLENMTAQKYTSPRTSEWWEEHDSPIKSFSRKYVQVKGVREGLAKSEGVTRVEVARLTSGAITRNVKRVMGSS